VLIGSSGGAGCFRDAETTQFFARAAATFLTASEHRWNAGLNGIAAED
jgi:hypothetical protein